MIRNIARIGTRILFFSVFVLVLSYALIFLVGSSRKIAIYSDVEVSSKEVVERIKSLTGDYYLLDSKYYLYNRYLIKLMLDMYCLRVHDEYGYIPEYHDCDDYALFVLYQMRHKLPQSACFFATQKVNQTARHALLLCFDDEFRQIIYDPTACEFENNATIVYVFG